MRTLLLTLLLVPMMSFGQSKKEQIASLNKRIDSLNIVLSSTRDKASRDIEELDREIEELNSENPKINIPDANFKNYLVGNTDINTNGDNEIRLLEALAFTGAIYCVELGVSDLTGIEAFTALTDLNCSHNQLTSLDVSNNTALTRLNCYDNQLTSLDVSNNTALTTLICQYNQLTSLDVSGCTALTYLSCHRNQLTSFVSNNTALTNLSCSNNQLTSLDVSGATALTTLHCEDNQLNCVKGVPTDCDLKGSTTCEDYLLLETLKKKYNYMQAEFSDAKFGDLLHYFFKDIDGKEYEFSFIEDDTYELLGDFDELNPKYKDKMFHIFYLTEEREIDLIDFTQQMEVDVIYKLILQE